jgi:hypothetical protein
MAGVVRDQQSLLVPGAAVTFSGCRKHVYANCDNGCERAHSSFAALLPGEYKVRVDLTGFALKETNVSIAVNQRVRLDLVLQPAAVAQQVQVTTTVPLLHVSDATVGEVIDPAAGLAQLPLKRTAVPGAGAAGPRSAPRRTGRRWAT